MADKPIAAIVLAAGASARLGQPKQLVEYEGLTLVRRAATAALDAGAAPVVVVLGSDEKRIRSALDGLPVRCVVNDNWKSGLASSISIALADLSTNPDIDGVVFVLGDQPLVDATALRILRGAFGENRIVASCYANTIGVPAIVGREYFGELSELEGNEGAGKWLRSRQHEVTSIPLSAAILDIDTVEDLARLRTADRG